jgi:hypothetical protein
MKRSLLSFAVVALAASLAGCGPSPQPVVYQQAPQPQVVYQQPPVVVQQQSGAGDVLTGMAIGTMLANGSRAPVETRVIERRTTVINNVTTPSAPVVVAAPVAPAKPSFVQPAAQPMAPVVAAKPSFAPTTVYQQAPIKATTITAAPAPRPAVVAAAPAPKPSFVQTAPKAYSSTTTTVRSSSSSTTRSSTSSSTKR